MEFNARTLRKLLVTVLIRTRKSLQKILMIQEFVFLKFKTDTSFNLWWCRFFNLKLQLGSRTGCISTLNWEST